MKKANTGDKLIFLFSQPRAGSTLLQRVLGCHPEIHTLSEPWIMLHPLHALKPERIHADYDTSLAARGLVDFLSEIPDGNKAYLNGLRNMYSDLYKYATVAVKKNYFLDKTPRYYYIIKELYELFPKAKFIILYRNPIAVLMSIMQTWVKDRLFSLNNYRDDLLLAPLQLLEGERGLGGNCRRVNYECFVTEPEKPLKLLCSYIGVKYDSRMIEYGGVDMKKWRYGDEVEIYKHNKPVNSSIEKWISQLNDSQMCRIAYDYLRILGEENVEKMGYSYNENCRTISGKMNIHRGYLDFGLEYLLGNNKNIHPIKALPQRLNQYLKTNDVSSLPSSMLIKILKIWSK